MYGEIVIADDGRAGGRDGLALAELLHAPGTTLVSAHDLLRRATVHVERELAHFARTVDLLVLGSHHHGAAHRHMRGDVAGGLVSHSPCPLLIVPARSTGTRRAP